MARYANSSLRRKNKKIFRGTTIYKKIPESNDDIWVITQYGDRLDLLSQQFYGTISLWWVIAKANHIYTLKVPDGTSIRIPAVSFEGSEFIE